MPGNYVVHVSAPESPPTAAERRRLAELLGLDAQKLESLLRRLPADVTKPVPKATAETVAERFREAGLDAYLQEWDGDDGQRAMTGAAAAGTDVERPDFRKEDPWDDRKRRNDDDGDDDDQLFPESAVSTPPGPKAPSRTLVIALLAVLALLVALLFFY